MENGLTYVEIGKEIFTSEKKAAIYCCAGDSSANLYYSVVCTENIRRNINIFFVNVYALCVPESGGKGYLLLSSF